MDTRAHIVQCAFRLFVQHSYKEVTLAQLTKAAGLSKGALYHYFDSKEHLFEAVVDTYFLSMQEKCYHGLAEAPSLHAYFYDYLTHMGTIFESFEDIFQDEPLPVLNMYQLSFDAFRYLEGVSAKAQVQQAAEHVLWQAAISRSMASGELRTDLDAAQLAKILLSLLDGVAIRLVMEQRMLDYAHELIPQFESLYALIKHPNYVATVPNNP